MDNAEQVDFTKRNFSAISPSAKMVLLFKGYTDIPFARKTAELISYPEKFVLDYEKKDWFFWVRAIHLEGRYKSIDILLKDKPVKNIMELSSGFSFRGLDAVRQNDVFYIDTDLPDMVAKKKELISALKDERFVAKGKLEILPLNVLDEKHFNEIASRFPEGEIAIVNEGLLMYLNIAEKEKLCRIIHRVLKEHGGYWITADISIKNKSGNVNIKFEDELQRFVDEQHIEENKFESFEDAEAFFKRMGFAIEKEAFIDRSTLSSMPYLINSVPKEQLEKMKGIKIQATWRLRAD